MKLALRRVSHSESAAIEESRLEGSHGNRIVVLEAQAKSGAVERALFADILRDDPAGFARLEGEAERRLDEHLNFFFRLDKQEAFAGRMVLASDDDAVTIRGKLRTFPKGGDPRARGLDELRSALAKVGNPKL